MIILEYIFMFLTAFVNSIFVPLIPWLAAAYVIWLIWKICTAGEGHRLSTLITGVIGGIILFIVGPYILSGYIAIGLVIMVFIFICVATFG